MLTETPNLSALFNEGIVTDDMVIPVHRDNGQHEYTIIYETPIEITLDKCYENSRGLMGLLSARAAPDQSIISNVNFSMYSASQRKLLATELGERCSKFYPWFAILDYVVNATKAEINKPPVLDNIDRDPENAALEYLLDPILIKNMPATIFAPGGKGKSLLADYFSVLVTHHHIADNGLPFIPEQTNVLILDWEAEAEIHRRYITAIERGMKLPHKQIYYMSCDKPLNNYIEEIQSINKQYEIGLIIIDSQMAATAQDPGNRTDADKSNEYYNNLRFLNCTSLTIDHVTKQNMSTDNNTGAPYGSVVKYNRSRSQWELKHSQETNENYIELALSHVKMNLGIKHQPIGMRIDFINDGNKLEEIMFSTCDITANASLSKVLPLYQQIRQYLLNEGECTVAQIAEALDATQAQVRARLNESRDKIFTKNGNNWGVRFDS